MSFVAEFNALPVDALEELSKFASLTEARAALGKTQLSLEDFARLLSPAAGRSRFSSAPTRRPAARTK